MEAADEPLRARVVAAAIDLSVRYGWSFVTMSRVADAVGVSRQSVYNEVGSKQKLAEAMVAWELERFLAAVDEELSASDALLPAIEAAARRVFEMAQDDPLLRAVLGSQQQDSSELLPLLTTRTDSLIQPASAALADRVLTTFAEELPDPSELPLMCAAIVRMVLSYITQPAGAPSDCAQEIAWMAGKFLVPSPLGAPLA